MTASPRLTENLPDAALGAGAMSLGWWSDLLHTGAQEFVLYGGAALVAGRLWLLWREIRKARKDGGDD